MRNKGYKWVVDADIHRYFDEVNHDLLMQEVEKLVTDTAVLRLINQWLKATVVDKNQRYGLTKGVPLGSPLSPLLANLFLDHLDDTLLDNNYRLVRYADDFVVLCKSPESAQDAMELTADILQELHLRFSQQKTRIVDFNEGFHFLGVKFIRSLAFKSKVKPRKDRLVSHQSTDTPATLEAKRKLSKKPKKPKPNKPHQEKLDWYSYALPAGTRYTSSDEMREAFAESGVLSKQFPSESEPEESIDPPVFEDENENENENDKQDETETHEGNQPQQANLAISTLNCRPMKVALVD